MKARTAAALLSSVLAAAAAGAQEVVLPLDRYDALRARAQASPPAPAPPAVPFAFESAEITLRPGPETVRARTRLTLVLFAQEWQTIPLPAGSLLTAADLGALEGRVDAAGSLTVRGTGRHVVTLDTVIPLATDAATPRKPRTLTLAVPKAAVVTGTVIVSPHDDIEFGGGALGRKDGATGTWSFVAPRGGSLQLRILGPSVAPERARLPLRFSVTTALVLQATRTRQAGLGWVRWEVAQGSLEKLQSPEGRLVFSLARQEQPQVLHVSGLVPWTPAPDADSLSIPLPRLSTPAATVDVRAVLPGGREYRADGGVETDALDPPPPPRSPVEAAGGLAALRVRVRPGATVSGHTWFPVPAGSVALLTPWSAISATPGPLALRVRSLRVKPEWF